MLLNRSCGIEIFSSRPGRTIRLANWTAKAPRRGPPPGRVKRLVPLYRHHGHAVAAQAPIRLTLGRSVGETQFDLVVVFQTGALLAVDLLLVGASDGIQAG